MVLVTHRSNPLPVLLRRFNAYSNNDIDRLEASLGPPSGLAGWLEVRWGAPVGAHFDSLSGLVSPETIGAFVLLGLLALVPVLVRKWRSARATGT